MAKATWSLDRAHSSVEFSVRHMMVTTVKGRFSEFEGTVSGDPDDLTTAEIDVRIETASVDTRDQERDTHLRSADFFDAEKYHHMTFKSKRITSEGDGDYRLLGELTLHGVTRDVELRLTMEGQGKNPWGKQVFGFSAEGKLNRKEFGLQWNVALESGGVLVSEQVRLAIEGQAVKQEPAPATSDRAETAQRR